MNDSLRCLTQDPIHRRRNRGLMNFALAYAGSEDFIPPLSHDEVVHGKGWCGRDAHRPPGPGREILNTDTAFYGGTNGGNLGSVETAALPAFGPPLLGRGRAAAARHHLPVAGSLVPLAVYRTGG